MDKVNIIPLMRVVPGVPAACATRALYTAPGRGCSHCAVNVVYHHQNTASLLKFILVSKCYTLGKKKID